MNILQLDMIGKNGIGCLTLIKEGIPYKIIDREGDLEYVGSEVWIGGKIRRRIGEYLIVYVKGSSYGFKII